MPSIIYSSLFFFNDTATTEIYTLSLHDALPISHEVVHAPLLLACIAFRIGQHGLQLCGREFTIDRKSTRLNSSHLVISYAVFCLKKKNHQILHASGYAPTQTSRSPSNDLSDQDR